MTQITPFLILGVERSGSFLLAGMLDSHPSIACGGELMNPLLIEKNELVLSFADAERCAELAALRARDSVAFVDAVGAAGVASGATAVGFKLLFSHLEQADELRDHLVAEKRIRIVHLRRVDLLRRYVSHQRAIATQQWRRDVGSERPLRRPAIEIDVHDFVEDVSRIERWERQGVELFAEHPMLEITYEELAAAPAPTGRRVAEFLSVDPDVELEIRDVKTGGDPLDEAVTNLPEVIAHLDRWRAWFDDRNPT